MYAVITASPNTDGLTAACGKAALKGITDAGGKAELYDLCAEKIEACRVCGNGWGKCLSEGKCVIEDRLQFLADKLAEAEGIVLVTAVYWAQPMERVKYFCDRVRRCEARKREKSALFGKRIHLVAAAGGSGNGTVSCLTDLELWCRHVGAIPVERIGVTRFNRDYTLAQIERAGADITKVPEAFA
jgi:multimeric flavodoxin WrbA